MSLEEVYKYLNFLKFKYSRVPKIKFVIYGLMGKKYLYYNLFIPPPQFNRYFRLTSFLNYDFTVCEWAVWGLYMCFYIFWLSMVLKINLYR